MDITENIRVYFTSAKHGINREIPTRFTLTRADGSSVRMKASVENFHSSENIAETGSSSHDNVSYKTYKIGDENIIYENEFVDYTFSYNYRLIGNDGTNKYDELYYNLIGTGWSTAIRQYSFHIRMPKEYDLNRIGFSVGSQGTAGMENALYFKTKGEEIYGISLVPLARGEGVTIRIELPDGYFLHQTDWNGIYNQYFVPCMAVVILFLVFMLYQAEIKAVKPTVPVNFYPPKGYDSAETGYFYKGSVSDKMVVSLLLSLADKRYVTLSSKKNKHGDYKDFKIRILDAPEGTELTKNEQTFLNGLKGCSDTHGVVTMDRLKNRFYLTTKEIENTITEKYKEKIFSKKAIKAKNILGCIPVLCYLLFLIVPVFLIGANISETVFEVFFIAMWGMWLAVAGASFSRMPVLSFICLGCWMFVLEICKDSFGIFNAMSIITVTLLVTYLNTRPVRRKKFGQRMLKQITGYRNFLKTAEKDKLEALVEKDPEYFYHMLPYTYALGVSDKWVKQFETMNLVNTDSYNYGWYSGIGGAAGLTSIADSLASSGMSSSSSTSSGSSSSGGGGSSGGGAGGGGGSSW